MSRGLEDISRACGLAIFAFTFSQGCKVDERELQISTPDSGAISAVGALEPGEAAGTNATTVAGSIGAACQQARDCDAGNCVDGVCCDSACTELCAACNAPGSIGVCSATQSDPLCPEAICQGQSSECRPLNGAQTAVNCEAVGVCRANAEC